MSRSTSACLAGYGPLDLVVMLDDATSAIYSAILVEEEGTMSSFRHLAEVIAAQGLCCTLYTDRDIHYFDTPEADGKVSRDVLTQVGRALGQPGIERLAAYSPEARERSERAFRTLQERLPKELACICGDVAVSDRSTKGTYPPQHNAQFAIKSVEAGSAFVPAAESQWRDVLCVQEEPAVAPDNTVSWNGRRFRLPSYPARAHFVGAKVRAHEYSDGTMAIFHGPRCLVRWDQRQDADADAAKQDVRPSA